MGQEGRKTPSNKLLLPPRETSPKMPMQNPSFDRILVSFVKFRPLFPESFKLLEKRLGKKGLLASPSALGRTLPRQEKLNAKLVGQSEAALLCLWASRPFPLRASCRNNNGLRFRAVAQIRHRQRRTGFRHATASPNAKQ